MAWNPTRYLRFEEVRLRPALELLSRAVSMVGAQPVSRVVDMGCGPGNVVPFLRQVCS
jgi:trans-aconitate 2-methyltransferase